MIDVVEPVEAGIVHAAERRIGWSAWGHPGGIPVLLSQGAGTAGPLGLARGVAEHTGCRIVAYDRPGLGRTSPVEPRTFATLAEDVRALCRGLGLDRPPMLANSQGAPFSLAAAAAGLVSSVAVVSGADELAHRNTHAQLPEDVAATVDAVLTDPAGARDRFETFDPAGLRRFILSGSTVADREVYLGPGFFPTWCRATDEAFGQGSRGYAEDTVLALGSWDIALSDIEVPVVLWYGGQDTGHSPDQGATLHRRIPGSRRVVVAGGGGALLWTHGEVILRDLLARTVPEIST